VVLTTHPHIAPRLKSSPTPLLTLCSFMSGYKVNLYAPALDMHALLRRLGQQVDGWLWMAVMIKYKMHGTCSIHGAA